MVDDGMLHVVHTAAYVAASPKPVISGSYWRVYG